MVKTDTLAFWNNEAESHKAFAYRYGQNPDVRYPMYEVRRDLVLELLCGRPSGRILDAGCGAGEMVVEFLSRGWEAYGFDFAESMVELARQNMDGVGQAPDRVRVGDFNDLSAYADSSFDVVVVLGVSQYLPAQADTRTWGEIRRVLKPGGHVLIDFVNALFDLGTFNRFTVRFVMDEFVRRFAPAERLPELETRVAALITHPEKPDHKGRFATRRDQVTKRAENPLTVAERMRGFGFDVEDKLFFRLHAVPPLMFEADPDLEKLAIAHEGVFARHWIGHFVASAFLAVLRKTD